MRNLRAQEAMNELIDNATNNPSRFKRMFHVTLVTNNKIIKIETFNTLLRAQHCAYLNFKDYDVMINSIPFTEDDYENYLAFLNWIES